MPKRCLVTSTKTLLRGAKHNELKPLAAIHDAKSKLCAKLCNLAERGVKAGKRSRRPKATKARATRSPRQDLKVARLQERIRKLQSDVLFESQRANHEANRAQGFMNERNAANARNHEIAASLQQVAHSQQQGSEDSGSGSSSDSESDAESDDENTTDARGGELRRRPRSQPRPRTAVYTWCEDTSSSSADSSDPENEEPSIQFDTPSQSLATQDSTDSPRKSQRARKQPNRLGY